MPFAARGGFLAQAGAPPGPPLWTPADITTEAWVEATASDLTLSGTNVTNWTNKANGTSTVDYANSTSSEQPTWDSAGGYVQFDGVDDYLQADSAFAFSGRDDIMVICVVDIPASSSYFSGVADKFFQQSGPPGGGSSTHGAYSLAAGSGSIGWNNRYNNGFSAFANGTFATKNLHAGFMASSDNYGSAEWYLNGSDIGPRSSGNNSGNSLSLDDAYSYLGGGPAGNTGQFMYANCKMYELVVLNDVTTTNRQLVEGYMAWKHGLEGDLPVGHPYKTAAPTT